MRSISTWLFGASFLFLLIFLIVGQGDFHGRAIDTFVVSAEVINISIDNGSAVQHGIPVTGGSPVEFTMDVYYGGSGVVNLAMTKPYGFSHGFNWSINESGTIKNVTADATNLYWEANLSQGSAVLHFEVLPPVIALLSLTEGEIAYLKQVRVAGDNYFTNVTATTTVSSEYGDYVLYESGNNETSPYNFSVSGTTATWNGFDVVTRTFFIVGVKEVTTTTPPSSGGGGGGGGGGGSSIGPFTNLTWTVGEAEVLEPVDDGSSFWLSSEWEELNLTEDEQGEAIVKVTNIGDEVVELSIESSVHYLEPSTDSLILGPQREQEVTITTHPLAPGEWTGRLIFSDGAFERQLFIFIDVSPSAEQKESVLSDAGESIAPVEQLPTSKKTSPGTFILSFIWLPLALISMVFFVYLQWRSKKHH